MRAKIIHPITHTRLPTYVMGKTGIIDTYHGAHCHHEALASGKGEVPEHLYAVKFAAVDLWGPDAEGEGDAVRHASRTTRQPSTSCTTAFGGHRRMSNRMPPTCFPETRTGKSR